jgi:peptidoglycan hydrolase FlgJ
MTLPVTSPLGASPANGADIYTDFAGLAALKKSVRGNDPQALRQVAKQYESLFARMMIKSMRDAVGTDPIFGSDEEKTYQEMYDDQLSLEMTKGHGLGLADMLVRQMQRLSGGGKTDSTATSPHANGAGGNPAIGPQADAKPTLRMFQGRSSSGGAASPAASAETRANFISELWPSAQEAGQQLGVDPRNLIAQAALETNWGTRVPRDASGRSSNNLFGMKASGQWNGAAVTAGTQEYRNGSAVSATAQFRAYDNRTQSFQDYVALLRNSPRYSPALNTGSNVQAFANALQRGGYATDPDYANKITSIAAGLVPRNAMLERSLKSASALPINPNTGIL